MSYEDLIEVLTPKTIRNLQFKGNGKEIKSSAAFDCVKAFWSVLRLELQYFR